MRHDDVGQLHASSYECCLAYEIQCKYQGRACSNVKGRLSTVHRQVHNWVAQVGSNIVATHMQGSTGGAWPMEV